METTATPIVYEPGTIVNLPRGEGRVRLVERTGETYPTKGDWTLARWQVEFIDADKRDLGNSEYFRAILEVGVPNSNVPQPVFVYSGYAEDLGTMADSDNPDDFDTDVDGSVASKQVIMRRKATRGRPAIAMNELKAKNLIRDYKQGKIEHSDDILEAVEFLKGLGQEAYVEKHYKGAPQ